MALIRFVTAQDLFAAFPTARQDVDAEPNDEPSLRFLQALADREEPNKAIAFCAYLLPRREAVWWGCRCIRALAKERPIPEEEALLAAENWTKAPEEDRRMAALELGMRGNPNWPSTWLALAAGWSGGNILLGVQATGAAPPEQTARAVRAAVLTAVSRLPPGERERGLQNCIQAGIRLAAEDKQSER